TEDAIEKALKKPGDININLVNAQQARRVLDRLVGYKLSPLLWKKIQFGLSAGRVQSVALRLIVEREIERDNFKPQDYFLIEGAFDYNKSLFNASLHSVSGEKLVKKVKNKEGKPEFKFLLTNEKQAKDILEEIKKQEYYIKSVTKKEKNRSPFPPFTTSLLQQAASNMFGFSAKRTMQAAQKLYEKGLITYHRTDSFNLSAKFLKESQTFINKQFGKEYYKKTFFKKKAKGAQEAHEAIRPTSLKKLPSSLGAVTKDEQLIYELVFVRSIATQMAPIKLLSTSVDISSKDNKFLFRANGQQVLFEGWAKAYTLLKTVKYNPLSQDTLLPDLKENTNIDLKDAEMTKKTTQPPARYSEASLIKTLEKYGIGRPSTYAPTISTLISRKYVLKESKYLVPTDLGRVVTQLLLDNFADIIDYDFTAKIEKDLDEIALGKKEWPKVVDTFYKPFEKRIKSSEETLSRRDYKVLGEAPKDIKCPDCGGPMLLKLGRNGKFYTCAKFPECKGMRGLDGKTEK
ncbi:MAG TPA: type I DNA topoisomerase, partial [candidate division WWE3 bacterium]|nr:type I DNA topoisomerase [candidate division WWE3 bacterium]